MLACRRKGEANKGGDCQTYSYCVQYRLQYNEKGTCLANAYLFLQDNFLSPIYEYYPDKQLIFNYEIIRYI
jgi:hypothetical protein